MNIDISGEPDQIARHQPTDERWVAHTSVQSAASRSPNNELFLRYAVEVG